MCARLSHNWGHVLRLKQEDALMFLYDDLNKETKNSARADPRTGQAWTDFDALANYLITVEISSGTSDASTPHSNARFTRKFKTPSTSSRCCLAVQTSRSANLMLQRKERWSLTDSNYFKSHALRRATPDARRWGGGSVAQADSTLDPPLLRNEVERITEHLPHHEPVPGGFDLTAIAKEAAENFYFPIPFSVKALTVRAFTEKGTGK